MPANADFVRVINADLCCEDGCHTWGFDEDLQPVEICRCSRKNIRSLPTNGSSGTAE
jgi:hypothetical protein